MNLNKLVMYLSTLLALTSAQAISQVDAKDTRLKRPTVLYGTANKQGQYTVNVDPKSQDTLKGSSEINSMFPSVQKAPVLTPQVPIKDLLKNRPLTGRLSTNELKLLSTRELIVFVDKSYSMNTRDCPPVRNAVPVRDRSPGFLSKRNGISRWKWVASATKDLAEQVGPYMPNGFKLIIFNDWKLEFNHVKASDVTRIFQSTQVGGSENIVLFLAEQLNFYIKKKNSVPSTKPLTIAVLTDGLPDDRKNFPAVLANITNQMASKSDIKILFIQIGQSQKGGDFLQFLDNQLTATGAKFDIVDHKSFQQVTASGVGRAIVDAIVE